MKIIPFSIYLLCLCFFPNSTAQESLAGTYTNYTVRLVPVNGPYIFENEEIDFLSTDTYNTTTVGQYYAPEGDPGTGVTILMPAAIDAGYTFTRVGTNLLVETQSLGSVYTNQVLQSVEQYASSTIDPLTGILTVEYTIGFITGNRSYRSIYTPHPLGIPDDHFAKLSAYPNPVRDILTLSSENSITEIVVYNLFGQQVLAKTVLSADSNIDISALPSGVYMVKVLAVDKSRIIKVVKD